MNRTRTMAWASWFWLLPFSLAVCDEPSIKPIPTGLQPLDAAILSLTWSPATDQLHVGTANGDVYSFYTAPAATNIKLRRQSNHIGDSVAVLALQGDGLDIFSAGISANPRATLLPGAIQGYFPFAQPTGDPQSMTAHFRSQWLAVRTDTQVRIVGKADNSNSVVAQKVAEISQKYDHVAWADTRDASGTKIWLAGYQQSSGLLHFWKAPEFTKCVEVRLPKTYPPPAGAFLELTCLCTRTVDGYLWAGDRGGNLRQFKVDVSTSQSVTMPADVAAYSVDGKFLVEHQGDKLRLRTVDKPEPPAAENNLPGRPKVLAYQLAADGKHYAATAWPENDDHKFEVKLTQFTGGNIPLHPHMEPSAELRALAIRDDIKQVAAANATEGVIFLSTNALTAIPAAMGNDDKIVKLSYAGKDWLVAVGESITIYDTETFNLSATKPLVSAAAPTVVAADFEAGLGSAETPVKGRLLIGLSNGEIQLLSVEGKLAAFPDITLAEIARTQATAAQAIRSVSLRQSQALIVEKQAVTTWQVRDDLPKTHRLLPLELTPSTVPLLTAAVAGDSVLLRTAVDIHKRLQSADDASPCDDPPAPLLAVEYAEGVLVAASAQKLFAQRGSIKLAPAESKFEITSLALALDGTSLIAGIKGGKEGLLQPWKIELGKLTPADPYYVHHADPDTTSVQRILLAKAQSGDEGPRVFIGCNDGRLLQVVRTKDGFKSTRLPVMGKEVRNLEWLPSFNSTTATEPDFGRFFTISDDRRLYIHSTSLTQGIAFSASENMAPWYATAADPTHKQIVAVSAHGAVFRANWPFPRRLKGFEFDPAAELMQPVHVQPPTTFPLYAVAWSKAYDTGLPVAASILTGGVDGHLYKSGDSAWTKIPTKTPDHAVLSLAAHPTLAVLAVGHGPGKVNPQANQTLSVWPKELKPEQARYWDGHGDPIRALAFSPNGALLASADRGTLFVWDCRNITNDTVEPPPKSRPLATAAAINGLAWIGNQYLALGLANGEIVLVEVTAP